MRVNALHDLAVEFEHKTQHAVGRRVLRPEIDGEIADSSFGHSGLALAAGAICSGSAGSTKSGGCDLEFPFSSSRSTEPSRIGHPVERRLDPAIKPPGRDHSTQVAPGQCLDPSTMTTSVGSGSCGARAFASPQLARLTTFPARVPA